MVLGGIKFDGGSFERASLGCAGVGESTLVSDGHVGGSVDVVIAVEGLAAADPR